MSENSFPINQVLTFNQIVAVADFIDCLPNTDRYASAVASAQQHVDKLASQAEDMAAAWNKTKSHAITLKVQKNFELGYRIVGHWKYGLAVHEYNQELNPHAVSKTLSKEAQKTVTQVVQALKINYLVPDEYIHPITIGIKESLYNSNVFSELRNTSFFKYFATAFDPKLLTANYHKIADLYAPFYADDREEQMQFKRNLRRTFEEFLEADSNHIVDKIINFELEQVALASAQACTIIQACGSNNKG